ncbi:hypothetical protein PENTCL1PPCAC_25077, partial [Pristionchus entomophagus]
EGVEQVACSLVLPSSVETELEESHDISVPRLEVHGKCTRSLISALINVFGRVVEYSEHRNEPIRGAVRSCDERALGADVVHVDADSSGR